MRTDQELAAYIGLDWGDQRHAVQIQAAAGGPVEQLELEQRPHVLHGWVAQLRERFGGRPVGIAIEPAPRRGDPRADAVRVPGALPGQSQGPGALSRSLPPQRRQGRPDRCRLTAGPAAQTSRPAPALAPGYGHRAPAPAALRAPPQARQSAGRPHEPAHQPAQAVFPPGPRLGRDPRLTASLRLSAQVADTGRRPAGPPHHGPAVLSAAQLPPRGGDRRPARRDGHRPAAHHRPGRSSTRSVWWSRATPPNCVPCSRPSTPSRPKSRPSSPPTRIRSCS